MRRPALISAAIGSIASLAAAGPDLIIADLPASTHWGSVGGIHSYSLSVIVCNIGDEVLPCVAQTNRHPVITQNMYRLSDGRFEQIGMSWAFHTYFALEQNFCSTCQPAGGGWLGPGCSDVHSAAIIGAQSALGPRSEINAATGIFQFPPTDFGTTGDSIYKRLQVHEADLTAAGALYFVEAEGVSPDDAAADNQNNNVGWRQVIVTESFNLVPAGDASSQQPAIMAWAETTDAMINPVDVPDDGRFYVGSLVTDNNDGTWTYEYAIQNVSSARAARGLQVPHNNATISSIGFHDVDYHSGESFDSTDWPANTNDTYVEWITDSYEANPQANALRWGTLYNFRFIADRAPQDGRATLQLFAPGGPASVEVPVAIPAEECTADFNSDSVIDFFDVAAFLDAFSDRDLRTDLTGDGEFNFFDVAAYLELFSAGCG